MTSHYTHNNMRPPTERDKPFFDHVDADRWMLILTAQFEIYIKLLLVCIVIITGFEVSCTHTLSVNLLFGVPSISGTCAQGYHLALWGTTWCKRRSKSDARAHLCKCYFGGSDLEARYITFGSRLHRHK